jgi:hypothetical protein
MHPPLSMKGMKKVLRETCIPPLFIKGMKKVLRETCISPSS